MTKTPTTGYADIAAHYRAEIEAGRLVVDDRLPTHRQLAQDWNVSGSTIDRAMSTLTADGLVTRAGRYRVVAKPRLTVLDWESIKTTVATMHDEIESEFAPHAVLTMSGPGSFAAFLALSINPRYVPVIAAVTFPANGRTSRAEATYKKAARLDTWQVLKTGKWTVYLPRLLVKYPEGSRILIFDDRVISGTTQRLARDHLEANGMEVRTAALVVSTNNVMNVDYFGVVIDDSYSMPWGTDRGRT